MTTPDNRRRSALKLGNYAAARAERVEIIAANRTVRDLAIALRFADQDHIDALKAELDRYVYVREEAD